MKHRSRSEIIELRVAKAIHENMTDAPELWDDADGEAWLCTARAALLAVVFDDILSALDLAAEELEHVRVTNRAGPNIVAAMLAVRAAIAKLEETPANG